MSYTDLSSAIAKLNELEATSAAYGHAMGVLSVDASTSAIRGLISSLNLIYSLNEGTKSGEKTKTAQILSVLDTKEWGS